MGGGVRDEEGNNNNKKANWNENTGSCRYHEKNKSTYEMSL